MTVQPDSRPVPQWTLPDRLRKAREFADLKQSELADAIGIGRTSVVSYESGKAIPPKPVLLSWAMACGVSHGWLCHGDTAPCIPDPGKAISAAQRRLALGVMNPCFRSAQTPQKLPISHLIPLAA